MNKAYYNPTNPGSYCEVDGLYRDVGGEDLSVKIFK